MNDALDGSEVWGRPCERDRGRRDLAGFRLVDAGLCCLSRCLASENEADVQRLRFDDHAIDIPFDQVAIRNGDLINLANRGKVCADTVEHEILNLGGRHTRAHTTPACTRRPSSSPRLTSRVQTLA